jgi:hypothetical protein
VRESTTVEHPAEQVVLEAVIERDRRRRAHHGDRLLRVQAEIGRHLRVGLEIRQVVLLLEAGIASQLATRAVAVQPLGRDRLGNHDRLRQPAVDVVLHRGPLVVERGGAGDPQQRRGNRDVVGPVPDGQLKRAVAPRPAHKLAGAGGQPEGLVEQSRAAVVADRGVLDPESVA